MRFKFEVEVEVNRSEGKFATRDELAEQLKEALDNADPSSLQGDSGGQYETADWSVNEVPEEKKLSEASSKREMATLVRELADAQGVDPDRCREWTKRARAIVKKPKKATTAPPAEQGAPS